MSNDPEHWVRDALHQARILVDHLETGGRDQEFLQIHIETLIQVMRDRCPDERSKERQGLTDVPHILDLRAEGRRH